MVRYAPSRCAPVRNAPQCKLRQPLKRAHSGWSRAPIEVTDETGVLTVSSALEGRAYHREPSNGSVESTPFSWHDPEIAGCSHPLGSLVRIAVNPRIPIRFSDSSPSQFAFASWWAVAYITRTGRACSSDPPIVFG